MPPKPKCTREDIINVAFEMVREKGIEATTAREIGKRLGTSATPIFTHFRNMQEVILEVRKRAMQEFESYVADAMSYTPALKQYGMQMVRFAREEPKLFQVLYMQEHEESQRFSGLFQELGASATVCVELIRKEYDLTEKEAYTVFGQVWMHTFSVCVLEANKICRFSEEEITEILGMEFQGTLLLLKTGAYRTITPDRKE